MKRREKVLTIVYTLVMLMAGCVLIVAAAEVV